MLTIDINLLFTVINVLILCVLVKIFLLKPVHKILDERQQLIEADLAQAEAARREAEALAAEHQQQMAALEEERAAAMHEAAQKATEVYDQIVASANTKAAGIIKAAEREGERERKVLLRQAEKEIRELVMDATAKVIGARTVDDSHLYDQFLEKAGNSDDQSES